MMNPVSLPLWILLVVTIGVPVHAALNRGLAHWRGRYEMSLMLTMALVAIVSLVILPLLQGADLGPHELMRQFRFALISGVLFGGPIGLILRAMVRPAH